MAALTSSEASLWPMRVAHNSNQRHRHLFWGWEWSNAKGKMHKSRGKRCQNVHTHNGRYKEKWGPWAPIIGPHVDDHRGGERREQMTTEPSCSAISFHRRSVRHSQSGGGSNDFACDVHAQTPSTASYERDSDSDGRWKQSPRRLRQSLVPAWPRRISIRLIFLLAII